MRDICLRQVYAGDSVQSAEIRERLAQAPGSTSSRDSRQYLAIEDSVEVGFASVDIYASRRILVIYQLFVPPAHRKRGIGGLFLRHLERLAVKDGLELIRLKPKPLDASLSKEDLIRFYMSQGYRPSTDDHLEKPIRKPR